MKRLNGFSRLVLEVTRRREILSNLAVNRMFQYIALAVFLLGLSSPTWAVDGTVQINQSKANAGGVTQGDTPGFPVTISRSGSYKLSGNLTVPDEDTTAIEIITNNVTLDLNGFAIIGPNNCPNYSCSLDGTGHGVNGAVGQHITVVNGSVRGMGGNGIVSGRDSRVERVIVTDNGGGGISAIDNSIVTAI